MIRIDNIQYQYARNNSFAIQDVSLSVDTGEIFTLLGPNGAGKTTLIRILSGSIIQQHGTVALAGCDLTRYFQKATKQIGLVLGDERSFYYRLTAIQNLEFFGGLYGLKRSELLPRIASVLDMVGLRDCARLQYMRFSTGMKKRLAFARALIHDPQVYLLDEPNSGVDPHSARSIRELMYALKDKGKTLFVTTHNMHEAELIADRIGFMRRGALIKIGDMCQFRSLVGHKTLEVTFGHHIDDRVRLRLQATITAATADTAAEITGDCLRLQYSEPFDVSSVLHLLTEDGLRIRTVNTVEPSLEDIFIKLAE